MDCKIRVALFLLVGLGTGFGAGVGVLGTYKMSSTI